VKAAPYVALKTATCVCMATGAQRDLSMLREWLATISEADVPDSSAMLALQFFFLPRRVVRHNLPILKCTCSLRKRENEFSERQCNSGTCRARWKPLKLQFGDDPT
jgi:hypothetical protein